MPDALVDTLFLSLFCVMVFAVAGVGVLALPWKDEELVAATRALRRGWRRLDHTLAHVAERVSARSAAPAGPPSEGVERPVVALDRPPASA